jgi:phage/plasmid-like protein (TIGR03299 family)
MGGAKMPHEVETMMWAGREAPWHGLGVQVLDAPDSEAALVHAGLDWSVVQRPVYTVPEDQGDLVEVPGWLANVRATDGAVLGIVTSNYRVIQNREAFNFMDALIGEGTREVRYQTAGSLRGGRIVWLLARLEEHREFLGLEVDPYLLFANAHDGSMAVRVMQTPIQVVCKNTLNLALRKASRSYKIHHTGDIHAKLDEARRVVGLTRTYLDELMAEAEKLAAIRLSDVQQEIAIDRLLPVPPEASDRVKETIDAQRLDLRQAWAADYLANFRDTGWGFVNAVTDFVAHRAPKRWTETWKENRMWEVVNGHPLVDRAREIVYAI